MKRIVTLLLALVMVFSMLTGCGGYKEETQAAVQETKETATKQEKAESAFDLAQGAYEDIAEAYELVDQFASDLNNAWYVGVNEKDEANGRFADHLSTKIKYLSKEELIIGIARAIAWDVDGKKWTSLTEEEKADYIEFAGSEFYIGSDSVQYFCISSLMNAYYINDRIEPIKKLLAEGKRQLKELNEKYPDYSHYDSLKGFYTATDAYFELCYSDGDGGAGRSFNQFKELRAEYVKESQDHMSDLEFEFED